MIKKERFKGFIFGIILMIVLSNAIGVFASGVIKEAIEVSYNNIKLIVDSKPVKFGKDSAGKEIEPFIYNGTTYLPVRTVGEAIGKKVNWDGATQTVYLGERPGEVSYMTEEIQPYSSYKFSIYKLNDSKKLNMGGVDYKTGYTTSGWDAYAYFNLDSQHKEIEGYIGTLSQDSANIDIILDGKLYQTIYLDSKELPKKINIPVTGVNQIRFEIPKNNYVLVGLGDLIIK